jgi:large subunit ribosomal protein L25
MQLVTLNSMVRETGRKVHRATVRKAGSVPAVIYGNSEGALAIAVNEKSLEKLLHTEGGMHAVVQLDFENAPEYNSPALMKAVQRHPIKDSLLHVDFLRIRLDQRIQTQVTVVLKGRAKGIIDGGVIDHQLREVDIECLALEMPDHIEVDITNLGLGESIHVGDLQVAEGVTILTDPELAVASVHTPKVIKTAAEEAEAAVEGEAEKEGESKDKDKD